MKIENIQTTASKIEDLKKVKFSNEKIMEILGLEVDPDKILEEYEKEKDYRTIEQAGEMIGKELEGTWNYRKVYNLLGGENPQIESVKQSNRQGIKIHIKEIRRFIAEKKLTREDYKNLYDHEIDKNVEMEKQVKVLKEENEEKDQKIAELEAKIAELEAQKKKQPGRPKKEDKQ